MVAAAEEQPAQEMAEHTSVKESQFYKRRALNVVCQLQETQPTSTSDPAKS